MAITAIIMADTKIIIPTKVIRLLLLVSGIALGVFGLLNVFLTVTPVQDANERLEKNIAKEFIVREGRAARLENLNNQQEELLAQAPADPFAWARLSWLWLITKGDRERAFTALKMSNLVSPLEPRQMLERAMMWHKFKDLHKPEDATEQLRLWRAAFRFKPEQTVAYARQYKMTEEIGKAFTDDSEMSKTWRWKSKAKAD